MLTEGYPQWMPNDFPRRFFRIWGLSYGIGTVLVLALGGLFYVAKGRYEILLPPAFIGSVFVGSYVLMRRMWPKEVGTGSDGLRLRFSRRRERFIAWRDMHQVTVMPASWKDDEWARIVYRDGREETRALIIGRTAHVVAEQFQRLNRDSRQA